MCATRQGGDPRGARGELDHRSRAEVCGAGPDIFSLLEWLPFNFVLRHEGQAVGHYKRVLGKFRDRYLLEIEPEIGPIDRRLLLAFTVALDALQDR